MKARQLFWLAAGLAACAPVAKHAATLTLDGTSWVAEDIGGGGIIENARVTADFAKGRLSGRSGCNNYMGSYTQDGPKLKIGPTAGTMMACPPALMELERKYLGILQGARGFAIDKTGALVITGSDGKTLLLRRPG